MRWNHMQGALLVAFLAVGSLGCEPTRPARPSPPTTPSHVAASDVAPSDVTPEHRVASPALFVRDQPVVSGLVRWGSTVVVRGQVLQSIDVATATASRLAIEGADEVIDVAMGRGRLAVVRDASGLFLAQDADGAFRRVDLPPALHNAEPLSLRLGAEATHGAIQSGGRLFVRSQDQWSEHAVDRELLSAPNAAASHVLVVEGILYAGYDGGEWGGQLLAFDLATGQGARVATQNRDELALPVKGLAASRDGRLWVARGLAHLGLRRGQLGFLRSGKWNPLARTEEEGPSVGWNPEPAAFDAMTLDSRDRVYVGTGTLGVVRRDGDRWMQLTPRWPTDHVYLSGLIVQGETLVIATYDAGVLLWRANTNLVRRVTLVR